MLDHPTMRSSIQRVPLKSQDKGRNDELSKLLKE